jgi:hypothetical protein
MHDVENCTKPECYGCKLASLQIAPSAMPSRMHPEHAPKRTPDYFARGVVRDSTGAPIRRPDGTVIGLREAARNPKAIERELRDRRNAGIEGTTPDVGRPRISVST